MEPEEYEQIPWSNLVAEQSVDRTRWLYLAAGIVAAVVVGIVAVRALGGSGEEPAALAVGTTSTAAPAPTSTTIVATTVPALLTEADLRVPEERVEASAVRMRAEWFVVDYFTVDGSSRTKLDLARAFVIDAVLPEELPHVAADQSATSYVEWARAFADRDLGDETHLVSVAFRTIFSVDGESFERAPVRAVDVVIGVDEFGMTAVKDLPMPIVVPAGIDISGWAEFEGVPPQAAVDVALDRAFIFEDEPEVLAAAGSAQRWRVVVTVADGSGIRWPMVIRSAGSLTSDRGSDSGG